MSCVRAILILSALAVSVVTDPCHAGLADLSREAFDEDVFFDRLDADERAYLLGLQYLMNCFQWKQYLTIDDRAGRDEWIETFWLQLDPTPTTPENERRIEHENRVAEARSLFSIGREPGWDRRGEIYIRFGEPDTRTVAVSDISIHGIRPPREKWYYAAFGMLVSFADITLNGEYYYDEEIPYSKHSVMRGLRTLHGYGALADVLRGQAYDQDPMFNIPFDEPDEWLTEKIDYCHESDISEERLPAYVDIASFRGGPGALKAEISFEIPRDEIVFDAAGGEEEAEIEFRVLVRNVRMDSVAYASDCITASSAELRNRPYSDLIPGQVRVTLEPGYYRFGIEATDRTTGKSSSYRRSVRLPVLDGRPAISDIQFAGRIRETEENGRFVKGNLEVVPHATHAYRKPRPVMFYFEVYGLDTDDQDFSFYAVEYTVTPLAKRRWGPVLLESDTEISSAFETTGLGSTQPLRLTIDTGELHGGPYRLLVSVRDRRTREIVMRDAQFHVLED